MKTSVADVNFMFTNSVSTIDKAPSVNAGKSDELSFTNYMNTAEKPVISDNKETVNKTQTTVEKPGRKDLDNQEANTDEVGSQDKDGIASKVEEKANEIKDAIKEKLGVSDEDIEKAMETLNLSMVDLLNPESLKDLMMSIAGQDDAVSLLTNEELYSDMMEVINLASDLTEEIKNEFDLTDEEFVQICSEVKTKDETVTEIKPEESKEETPNIKVEINVSEEMRTSNSGIVTNESNTKQSQNNQDFSNESAQEEMPQMSQTTMQTETVTVSDTVETVRQFSSYTNGNEVVSQVTEFIKVNISPETTSMELQLHPASLGTVNMNIVSQNGVVTAQLFVQSESVKEALEAQLIQLQEVFDEQGTKVEAVEVAVASYDLDRGPFQDRDDRQDRQNADKGNHKKINLNLNDLDDDDLANLDEEDQLARHVMEMNGTSIDFSA